MRSDLDKFIAISAAETGRDHEEDRFYIQTSGTETLANCTPDSGVFLYVSDGTARMKEIYATLLVAQLADKKVFLRVNEGTNPCTVAYVRLARQ